MNQSDALVILNKLIGQPFLYGIQSPDVVLFDLGFGDYMSVKKMMGSECEVASYTLHAICGIKIIHPKVSRQTEEFIGNSSQEFNSSIQKLIGNTVMRIALSSKNDLWLDLGDYWLVLVTNEDKEESWRYFTPNSTQNHMVVSDAWIRLE